MCVWLGQQLGRRCQAQGALCLPGIWAQGGATDARLRPGCSWLQGAETRSVAGEEVPSCLGCHGAGAKPVVVPGRLTWMGSVGHSSQGVQEGTEPLPRTAADRGPPRFSARSGQDRVRWKALRSRT